MRFATDIFRAVRSRARRGIWTEGGSALVVVFAIWALCSFVLDRGLRLETSFRAVLLAAGVIALLRTAVQRLMRPLSVDLNDEEIALAIERGDRRVGQALISAVEFERDLSAEQLHGQSATLMHGVVEDMARRVTGIDVRRAIDGQRVRRRSGALLFVLGGFVLATLLFPDAVGLWARRNLLLSSVEWPRATTLAFEGIDPSGTLRVAERDDVTLRVRASGVVPEQVDLEIRFAAGDATTRAMERTDDGVFTSTLSSLLDSATVVASGGDGLTDELRIEIVPRPRIADLRIVMTPPAYIAEGEQLLESVGGELRVPRGSRLRITGTTSKPLRSAHLNRSGEFRLDGELDEGATHFELTFEPEESGTFELEVVDRDDLGPAQPTQLFLRVLEDTPPQSDFQTQGIGSLITADARIPGVLRLRDDHGLGGVTVHYRVMDAVPPEDGQKPPEQPFAPTAVEWQTELELGATEAELELVWDLMPLMKDPNPASLLNEIRPDTLLSMRFDATDRKAPDAQQTAGEVRTFRVVTHEKLLQELRRRQGEQRRELERVKQKVVAARAELSEILSPTAEHPDAPRARLRVDQIARQQNVLAKTSQSVADRYRDILGEMVNNRLFEPNVVRGIEAKIVSPLVTIALEDFPDSARLIAGFSADGKEETRAVCVEVLDALIARLERIIDQMDRTEDLAALVETLRVVIRTEAEAHSLVQRLRDAQGSGLFGGRDDGKKEDGK